MAKLPTPDECLGHVLGVYKARKIRPGDVLMIQTLRNDCMNSLTGAELSQAIALGCDRGLIEWVDSSGTKLRLTDAGFDLL